MEELDGGRESGAFAKERDEGLETPHGVISTFAAGESAVGCDGRHAGSQSPLRMTETKDVSQSPFCQTKDVKSPLRMTETKEASQSPVLRVAVVLQQHQP